MSFSSPFARRLGVAVRRTGVTLALASVAAFALPPVPATAATAPIPAEFFGLHHAGLHAPGAVGWPQTTFGSVRVWDNGVSWREIETRRGVFNWTRLDAIVAKARSNGASVLLVLGQTPRFHSSRPGAASAYGPGASAMPRSRAVWVRYVQAVARRNATVWGGAVDLQVWNEANAKPYWSGTPAQMATLTMWTRQALRGVGSNARLVAPAMVTRLSSQKTWIDSFYRQRPGKRNVSTYVDALSFQLYPLEGGSPEASMTLLRQVRATLARHKVSKPIWNTEVNYGLVGGPRAGAAARPISESRQVANVMRTYLLNAENRVQRVYWYSWDLLRMSNTSLVFADRTSLTAPGRAFGTVRSWILGTQPLGCLRTPAGVYVCRFRSGATVLRAVWHPSKQVGYTAPTGSLGLTTVNGSTQALAAGTRVSVGPVPVLLRGSV